MLEIWIKCAKCVLFELNNDTALNKNVIFCFFCFPQVVQKQTFGEAGTNDHLMASCVWNIHTKNYENLIITFQLTIDKFWCVFMPHVVHIVHMRLTVSYFRKFSFLGKSNFD